MACTADLWPLLQPHAGERWLSQRGTQSSVCSADCIYLRHALCRFRRAGCHVACQAGFDPGCYAFNSVPGAVAGGNAYRADGRHQRNDDPRPASSGDPKYLDAGSDSDSTRHRMDAPATWPPPSLFQRGKQRQDLRYPDRDLHAATVRDADRLPGDAAKWLPAQPPEGSRTQPYQLRADLPRSSTIRDGYVLVASGVGRQRTGPSVQRGLLDRHRRARNNPTGHPDSATATNLESTVRSQGAYCQYRQLNCVTG